MNNSVSSAENRPFKMAYKALILATLILGTPFFVHAGVIAQQTDNSAYAASGQGNNQKLGTLLNGTAGSLTVEYHISAFTSAGYLRRFVAISCYTDPSYTTHCPTYQESTYSATSSAQITASGQDISVTFDLTHLCSGGSACTSSAPDTLTFNPAYYYGFSTAVGSGPTGTGSYTFNSRGTTSSVTPPCWFSCDVLGGLYYVLSDGYVPPVGTNTRIDYVIPHASSTIATSSTATFGAVGYVATDDYQDGMYIEVKYAPYSFFQSSVANISGLYTTLDFPITSSGAFAVSTTSPALTVGQYQMLTSIHNSSYANDFLSFIGFGQFATFGVLTATTTTFTAAHLSGYDAYVASTTASIQAYLASSTISLASCSSWTSFSLQDCLNLLFVPQTQPIAQALENFRDGFMSYFPWGYVTRFAIILSGSATTSLPVITTTFPLGSATDMDTFTFDPGDMLTGGAALLDSIHANGSSRDMKDIVQPWVDLFIALTCVVLIVRDVTKIGHGGGARRGRLS